MRAPLLLVLGLAGVASADTPTLRITHEPPPRHLRMRPRLAATPAPAPKPVAKEDSDDAKPTAASSYDVGTLRDLRRPVSVRFNLGYVVDGTNLANNSPDPNCAMTSACALTLNNQVVHPSEIARLRAYALGEGYFSSRGVVFPSLS